MTAFESATELLDLIDNRSATLLSSNSALLLTDWLVISECIEQFDLFVDRPLQIVARRIFAGALHFVADRPLDEANGMDGSGVRMMKWPPAIGVMIDSPKLKN